ncbi:YncE family protein [Haloterrigena alkaliphila]|uniref:40-residue YVTN family beta-propeller repeat-containing protein n=1 Tax=Haloterrigena alkaliphila TaxID=2816475 RepID=A0A8A2VAS1_9EURY|nr:hypothetical protein [Haloterrigena alkaliphila]QSW99083.1 hypothetical protein J0X25_17145 [Haloterrigena alkaliphila]
MNARPTRRRFLQTGCAVGGVALAGCFEGDESSEPDGNADGNGDGNADPIFDGASPIYHEYTQDGRYAYATLGPAYGEGGAFVFDIETLELEATFPDVPANYATIAHPSAPKLYLTGGAADTEETAPAGEWWAFDTERHELLEHRESNGHETHGGAFTPDGEELWLINRDTGDALVIDPETDEAVAEVDYIGESPDVITMSPDGRYAYTTTRGAMPQSGPRAIRSEEPGLNVVDVHAREYVGTVQPDPETPQSDFHGIGMVPGGRDDEFEVWAVDQGTATLYVLEPTDGGASLEIGDAVDLGDAGAETPHAVAFDSQYRYAAIPSTSGAATRILRVDDRAVVDELETGANSHFASFTPDDGRILVDVIGAEKVVEIEADLESESFAIDRELSLSALDPFPGGE